MKKILVLFETNSKHEITQFIGGYSTHKKAVAGANTHSAFSLTDDEKRTLEHSGHTVGRKYNYKLTELEINQTSLEGFIYVFKKSKV
jgi:hypothetical protein